MKNKYLLGVFFTLLYIVINMGCSDSFDRRSVEESFYVNKKKIEGEIGHSDQLIASPTSGSNVYTWASEDLNIVEVDGEGKVKLVGLGQTVIVVTSGEMKVTVDVVVKLKD
ncbi:Ig-like domain-containing protein [Sphingobacterium sp. UT-1RO-CII-1]|uniref:Ig-like domain-containing protein n=1 Tax=Sphingobacterium sp. UT-1RO-CII-1 TaxID=2995225 RepID=UPI00227B40E1|nr:Ig-like domain-containing protein [Sphingobacterium sp. UT-1RO-CII-1]MCY4780194.1 Ig-like domain-containing protein [Sphingobacterium sp. UT-1RO-CII-1]